MSDNSAGNWCLIESDPGVFTELIKEFGEHKRNCRYCCVLALFYQQKMKEKRVMFIDKMNSTKFLGVEGLQVEELWSLDPDQFKNLEYEQQMIDRFIFFFSRIFYFFCNL